MQITDSSPAAISAAFVKIRSAAEKFASYSQESVDKIFFAAAEAAAKSRIPLARLAVEETGMGVFEDKVIKNQYAAEYIYNAYKDTRTAGIIEEDASQGIVKTAHPVGVITAVIPTTNPTSTCIFKCLIALKTRNAILISPHPRAKNCTAEAARIILEAAVKAGAPHDIIAWIAEPSLDTTTQAMKDADLILATGGPGMVRAAYSSGKPAIGVGAGNTPAVIHTSANIEMAASSIIHSKTFDNGMICASEQSVVVLRDVYDAVKKEFSRRGCCFLSKKETDALRAVILVNGAINSAIVGQSAVKIAEMAGLQAPDSTKILVGEVESTEMSEAFAHEKLSPVLAFYKARDFDDALSKAESLVNQGGPGHTAALYIDEAREREKTRIFCDRMKAGRVLINSPASHGAIGDLYNFRLPPSLTLGCGSWGGNSVSENVGVKHLLNIKICPSRRENMLWFRAPEKIYIKRGSLSTALDELKTVLGKKRAFLVTDKFLYENNYAKPVEQKLDELRIARAVFFNVAPDPTLACVREGAVEMEKFKPDVIIALGGGSAMDAAKIMWVLYEHPEADFAELSMRFADIRKRISAFPRMGGKSYFIAIPTTAGTGSEVTPFAVITDESTGIKYPLADYELLPDMAIVDADLMMSAPPSLTAASGIDAATHALEAYASVMATDFTDALALKALRLLFDYLPRAYNSAVSGEPDAEAREKTANAATIAGMAFANAFLGVCHSMAHKLGSFHHLPHGIANALLICRVMKYNAEEAPPKMGTFPQYTHPHALRRYAEIAEFLGLQGKTDGEKLASLVSAVEQLKKDIGIKSFIRDYGVSEKDFEATLDDMSTAAFDDQCTGANPRYPLVQEIKALYRESYGAAST